MQEIRGVRGMMAIAAAVAFLAIVAIASPATTGAQSNGSIDVQVSLCPAKYSAEGWDEDCQPLRDVEVAAYFDMSEFGDVQVTGADGRVAFPDFAIGDVVVEVMVPGDLAQFESYCTGPDELEPRKIQNEDTNRLVVPLVAGDELICFFYITPLDENGESPIQPGGAQTLPPTGVGSILTTDSSAARALAILGGVVALAGLCLFTAREDLFER
jgi:hypothetical protein